MVAALLVQSFAFADQAAIERLEREGSCPACDLRVADLEGALLANTVLDGADLRDADLRRAMEGTNFDDTLARCARITDRGDYESPKVPPSPMINPTWKSAWSNVRQPLRPTNSANVLRQKGLRRSVLPNPMLRFMPPLSL